MYSKKWLSSIFTHWLRVKYSPYEGGVWLVQWLMNHHSRKRESRFLVEVLSTCDEEQLERFRERMAVAFRLAHGYRSPRLTFHLLVLAAGLPHPNFCGGLSALRRHRLIRGEWRGSKLPQLFHEAMIVCAKRQPMAPADRQRSLLVRSSA